MSLDFVRTGFSHVHRCREMLFALAGLFLLSAGILKKFAKMLLEFFGGVARAKEDGVYILLMVCTLWEILDYLL